VAALPSLKTRKGLLLVGFVLLFAALLCPTPWGNAQGGSSGTWVYVLANWMRPESYGTASVWGVPRSLVIVLASLTNVVFILGFGMRDAPNPSRAFCWLMVAAPAIALIAALFLHDFAKMPGYWFWVAALGTVMWAFVARPAKGEGGPGLFRERLLGAAGVAPKGEARAGVPAIVWVWIGWVAFWFAITGIGHWMPQDAVAPAAVEGSRPAALTGYVNDFAGVLESTKVGALAASLKQFEKETSTQLVVAIYPKRPEGAIEDFTMEIADLSKLGRKGMDNGAILSIFGDRAARLEVGYGLEGALTDAQSHRILETILAPAWTAGNPGNAVELTLAGVMDTVRTEARAGKMPSPAAVFLRQLTIEIPKYARALVPTLVAVPTEGRLAIAFFGTFFLLGFWDGFLQARVLAGNAVKAVSNLRAGRPISQGTKAWQAGSLIDSLKVAIFVIAICGVAAGFVVVAGGGAFGGAGATLVW
jgi:uncharacterized protein